MHRLVVTSLAIGISSERYQEGLTNLLNQEHTHYLLLPTFLISPNFPTF
jgi:hypothetical protein